MYGGRIGRARFFFTMLGIVIVVTIVQSFILMTYMPGITVVDQTMALLAVEFVGIILQSGFVVERIHDLDRPGSHYWLMFLPLYNIYFFFLLIFKKGTPGSNTYGSDPLLENA